MDDEKRRQFKAEGFKIVGIKGKAAIKDLLHGINLEKEYHLIQIKQSKLSAIMRQMVIDRYERIQREKDANVPEMP